MTALRLPTVVDVEVATDRELARAGAAGAPDAFAELYRRHAPAARGVARAVLSNDDDASDAAAEAFTKVFSAISEDRFSDDVEFRPYLLTTVRNAAVDHVRRTARLAPTSEVAELDGHSPRRGPSESVVASEESQLVAEAFRDLPSRWQCVLWLTEVEGIPPREAAEVLGVSANNVAQLATRARARLRERFLQAHVRNNAGPRCQATLDRLGAYLAGTLPVGARQAVDDHLAGCAPCRARLAEVQDVGHALRRAAIPLPLLAALTRQLGERRIGRHEEERDAREDAERGPEPAASAVPPIPSLRTRAGSLASRGAPAAQTIATSPVAVMASVIAAEPLARLVVRAVTAVVGALALLLPGGEHGRTPARAAPAPPPSVTTVAPTTVAPTTVPPADTAPAAPAPVAEAAADPAPTLPHDPGPLPVTHHPRSTVARAVGPAVGIYDGPDGAYRGDLENPLPSGAERVFLVTGRHGDWYQVLLPVRPNGSTGWVHGGEVGLSEHDYSIVIELGVHRITAFRGQEPFHSERVGVGKANTPTPGGLHYTKELVEIVDRQGRLDPHGPYGPFAFGLSGFSDVLFSFGEGGDGTVGIHGTNDPSSLGRDVSSGCIRMSNAGVSLLADVLPLGVPVDIRA